MFYMYKIRIYYVYILYIELQNIVVEKERVKRTYYIHINYI